MTNPIDIHARKAVLRKQIRAKLSTMDMGSFAEYASNVLDVFTKHPKIDAARTIFSYWSLPSEVPTHDLNRSLVTTKKVILPVINGDELDLSEYDPAAEMSSNNVFNICEPTGAPFTAYEKIDVVIVPGLAFTKSGNRCGKGKGYYDKTLVKMPHAYKIGLCFKFQLVDELPTDSFDVRMDEIVAI